MPLIRFPTVKGLVYTIDLSKIADRANPTIVDAPIAAQTTVGDWYIDWGDGTTEYFASGSSPRPTHEYADVGTYTVVIRSATGTIPRISFGTDLGSSKETNPDYNSAVALVSVDHFAGWTGSAHQEALNGVCYGCMNLKYVDTRWPGLSRWRNNRWTFRGCTSLEQPLESFCYDFAPMDETYSFENTFYKCIGLTGEIPPGFFKRVTQAKSFSGTFCFCSGLTGSIPAGLFDNNTVVSTFANTFRGCSGLTGSIPEGLFDNNTEVTTFVGVFQDCSALTGSIPAGLFDYNTENKGFAYTFSGCRGLTGQIPTDLFKYNTQVTTFADVFQNCVGLTGGIPSGLFDTNTANTTFYASFYNCNKLTGAPYIFWNNDGTLDTTKFPSLDAAGACYTNCSAALRAQVPTDYGGTMTVG